MDKSRTMPVAVEERLKVKAAEVAQGVDGEEMYLFTTKTCPNCQIAKEYLRNMSYHVIDAEEHPELAQDYGIMQAPTLVVVKDGLVKKYVNASNIKKFVDEQLVRL